MREEKKEKQKQNILRSAALVFSEKGYLKSTMSAVAERASIGKGTIYGYFSSKDELFFEVFKWYNQQIFDNIDLETNRKISQKNKILNIAEVVMKSVMDLMEFYGITMEFWSAASSSQKREIFKKEFQKIYGEFTAIIKKNIELGIENNEFANETDSDNIARGIICILDTLGLQYWLVQDFNPVYTGVDVIRTILKGIEAEK